VLRLIDLLHVAVDDVRQGGDPRLPLELALVKVTRPGADLSRESTAYRLEQLEKRVRGGAPPAAEPETDEPPPAAQAEDAGEGPPVDLGELQAAWKQSILPTVSERSIPTGSVLAEARPVALEGDRLVLEFPPAASFHRGLAEDPKNASVLAAVLHEVTGRRLAVAFELGEGPPAEEAEAAEEPATEEEIIALVQTTFDTRKIGKDDE
jgi:DNA polymerase III subunit gamma/tau